MTKFNTSIDLKRKVDLLKCLQVNMQTNEEGNLLMIKASGISESEGLGIPKLILTKDLPTELSNGILEFNFIVQGGDNGPKKKAAWDVAVVYQMDFLPKGIKAIKVNAAQNADIAMVIS